MTLSILNKLATLTLVIAALNTVINDGQGYKFLVSLVVWLIVSAAKAEQQ
jgi:hypothetical protein